MVEALQARASSIAPALLLLAACDILSSSGRPEQARLRLVEESSASIEVVTSTRFGRGIGDAGQTVVDLLTADTQRVSMPLDRTFDIRSTERFYVEVLEADSTSELVHMQVWIDGEKKYDQTADLLAGGVLRFVYTFNY